MTQAGDSNSKCFTVQRQNFVSIIMHIITEQRQNFVCINHAYYQFIIYFILSALELGPTFFPPIPVTTLTYRRLYCMRFFARPRGCFFFSWASTLGVWPFTLPARASDP